MTHWGGRYHKKHGSIPDVIRIKCGGNIANIANIAT